jgi:phosphatidylserine decarboxylase
MRIPITKYGLPQAAVYPAIIIALMVICGLTISTGWILWTIEAVLLVVFCWILSFFRDPQRKVPTEKDILLSPADGKIVDIETVDENTFINGRAVRVGIFLSVFNVHINRMPCNVRVESVKYKSGGYKDARNPQAGEVNESNNLCLIRTENPQSRLIVRQISGAIARRIVCEAKAGDEFSGGQRFGMIKFGSRTEIYVPANCGAECIVKTGGRVKAGQTILFRYRK